MPDVTVEVRKHLLLNKTGALHWNCQHNRVCWAKKDRKQSFLALNQYLLSLKLQFVVGRLAV